MIDSFHPIEATQEALALQVTPGLTIGTIAAYTAVGVAAVLAGRWVLQKTGLIN